MKKEMIAIDYVSPEGKKNRVITSVPDELQHKYNFVEWAEIKANNIVEKEHAEIVGMFVYVHSLTGDPLTNWIPIKEYKTH